MTIKFIPTPDILEDMRQAFSYDPLTGELRWAKLINNRCPVGSICDSVDGEGYGRVNFRRISYRRHRIAWFLHHGTWPDSLIDHINGDPLDNRADNLRQASDFENAWNARCSWNSRTGIKGVTALANGRYSAKITRNRVTINLGNFDKIEDAGEAYRQASLSVHGDFSIHRRDATEPEREGK